MSDVPDWFAKLFWGGDIDGNDCDAKDAAKPLWIKLTDHIRAVIADEAAKDADAKQPQPAEPLADDPLMPNWFCEGYAADDGAIFLWRRVIDELTHRVAEATAERDKRIAELDSLLADANAAFKAADEKAASEKKSRVEYQSIVYDACRLLDEKTNPPDCSIDKVAERIMGLRKQLGEVWKDAESLRQQLADATAEVSRLKRDAEQGQAVAEVANMHGWNGCEHSKVLSVHIAEELTELAKLREEVARLTRPVECASVYPTLDGRKLCVESWEFQRERAAREAAEAERDELRSAWKFCYAVQSSTSIAGKIGRWFASIRGERGGPVNGLFDDPNDAVLAAYRAEKGKVQQ